jgi:hypothetical protein
MVVVRTTDWQRVDSFETSFDTSFDWFDALIDSLDASIDSFDKVHRMIEMVDRTIDKVRQKGDADYHGGQIVAAALLDGSQIVAVAVSVEALEVALDPIVASLACADWESKRSDSRAPAIL